MSRVFPLFCFLPSQDQKEERDIVCGGMHGDIYLQHQPICTSLGRWIITFHLETPQKTLNAIIGEKNGCHYGIVSRFTKRHFVRDKNPQQLEYTYIIQILFLSLNMDSLFK